MQHSYQVRRAPLLVVVSFVLLSEVAWPQQTHFVDVGLNGTAAFFDRDSGRNSTAGQVPTVIRVGDSVQWLFLYGHSSTSGTCCTPNGIWDSGIKPGPSDLFARTFSSPGVFPYFCLVHFSVMQGKVIVVEGPEFFLEVNNPGIAPPPVPIISILADQTATFSGSVAGYLGYSNPVNVSCRNGSPRLPGTCSAVTIAPDGKGSAIPFNLTVSDPTPGTYTFEIVAAGTDPRTITKRQQVQLQVSDLILSAPEPQTVTAIAHVAASDPSTFQLQSIGEFSGFVNVFCTGLPGSSFCFFDRFPFLTPGSSEPIAMQVSSGTGPIGIHEARIMATVSFGPSFVTRSRPFTLRLLPADHLSVAAPATATSGTPFNVTVRAVDRNETVINAYNQTVRFSSTDSSATVPADQVLSGGIRTVPVTLRKLGPRTVTARDLSVFATTGTSPVVFVQPASAPNNHANISSSRSPATGRDAYFRNHDVMVTVVVAAVSGSVAPSGKVHLFLGAREVSPAAGLNLSTISPGSAQTTFAMPHLPPGNHIITAVYDGDANFAPSVSLPFAQPRSPAPRCVGDRCPGSH